MGLNIAFLLVGLSGLVVSPDGTPIEKAHVNVRNAALADVAVTISGPEGRFLFESLPSGSFLLQVRHPGFADWQAVVDLSEGSTAERMVRLSVSPVRSEVTVTAESGTVAAMEDLPQRMTIVRRGVLEERSFATLAESATGEAGIAEQRTSSGMGAYFVRGLTGKNVAVYRDGVRLTTSVQRGGVSTFFNLSDAALLESVEVLRGPGSSQYGSDAMGGAVSLVSQSPSFSPEQQYRGEASVFYVSASNSFGSQAQALLSTPRFAAALSAVGRRVNPVRTGGGLDSHAAVQRFLGLPSSVLGTKLPDTGLTQYVGAIHAQAQLTPLRQLIGHYERQQQDGSKRYDQLLGGDGNLIADLRNLMADFAYLRYQGFRVGRLDQFALTGSFNTQREERVNQGGAGNPLARITHQYERVKAWGVQALGEKRAGTHDILFGGDTYIEHVVAPAFRYDPVRGSTTLTRPRVPDGARYVNYGAFVQDAWEAPDGRLRLSGALRIGGAAYESRASDSPLVDGAPLWPDDSLHAAALSGRAGAVFRAHETLNLSVQCSRGFRAPSVTDLGTLGLQGNGFYEASAASIEGMNGTVGDSAAADAKPTGQSVRALRPETSNNVEAAVTWRTSRFRAEVAAFALNIGDAIVSQTLLLPAGAVGMPLGDQIIIQQLDNGAVYVPVATNPVLVRANLGGARFRGVEQSLRFRIHPRLTLSQNFTWVRASDSRSGLPPDIEPGVPAPAGYLTLLYAPLSQRYWVEAYAGAADRQSRISTLALADRRIGGARSRNDIAAFFANGARVRGLVQDGRLVNTGETLSEVQARVLGSAQSAPLFTAIPGYATIGVRGGFPTGSRSELMIDLANLTDRNYRGIGWGIDGAGRSINLRWRIRF